MKKLTKLLVSLFICTLLILSSTVVYEVKTIETNDNKNILALNTTASTKNIKNIAVFIEFADSETTGTVHLDDKQSVENANIIFNSDDLFDMNTMKEKVTGNY